MRKLPKASGRSRGSASRVNWHVGLGFVLALLAAHCGNGDSGASPGSTGGDGGPQGTDSSGGDGSSSLPPPVPFKIVRDPDTGCVATTSAPLVKVYATATTFLSYTKLTAAGPRRAAVAVNGQGFVLFDADGKSPSPAPIPVGETSAVS